MVTTGNVLLRRGNVEAEVIMNMEKQMVIKSRNKEEMSKNLRLLW
jgi:hypothetical protein